MSRRAIVLLIATVTMISGCATPFLQDKDALPPPDFSDPAESTDQSERLSSRNLSRPSALGRVPAPRDKPVTLAALPAPSKPQLSPKALLGMNEVEARKTLGEPEEIQENPPSQVWKYKVSGCELDLFLYPDLNSRTFYVLQFDLSQPVAGVPAPASTGTDEECWNNLQALSMRKRS